MARTVDDLLLEDFGILHLKVIQLTADKEKLLDENAALKKTIIDMKKEDK